VEARNGSTQDEGYVRDYLGGICMGDSEEGKSFVGMLKDKRYQLGIALFLLAVWNFWVLWDKGYVMEAMVFVLEYLTPSIIVFVLFLQHIIGMFDIGSAIIGTAFGLVGTVAVIRNIWKNDGLLNKSFIGITFFVFGMFLLPIWSLYDPFSFKIGIVCYMFVWLLGLFTVSLYVIDYKKLTLRGRSEADFLFIFIGMIGFTLMITGGIIAGIVGVLITVVSIVKVSIWMAGDEG